MIGAVSPAGLDGLVHDLVRNVEVAWLLVFVFVLVLVARRAVR